MTVKLQPNPTMSDRPMYLCKHCRSYHVDPLTKQQHTLLMCKAPCKLRDFGFEPKEVRVLRAALSEYRSQINNQIACMPDSQPEPAEEDYTQLEEIIERIDSLDKKLKRRPIPL